MDSPQKEPVVVTGFGPFRQYLVNASWEAAKGLQRAGLGEGIEIHTVEIPVSYSKAQQAIAEIWQNMKPKVAVHLGIAPGAKCIILEQTAKNHGYKDRDVCGFCPANNCCVEEGVERLDSIICMRSLAKHLKGLGLDVIYSRDAGREGQHSSTCPPQAAWHTQRRWCHSSRPSSRPCYASWTHTASACKTNRGHKKNAPEDIT